LQRAGGVEAVMKEIQSVLHLEVPSVTGRTVGETIARASVRDRGVIRPFAEPHSPRGGLSVLFGNLAPEGAVVKAAAVDPKMMQHRGPARCFNSEDECTESIMRRDFKEGDVLVLRYEGPRGGPGMPEMLSPTSMLRGMGVDDKVALITDGGSQAARARCHRPRIAGGGGAVGPSPACGMAMGSIDIPGLRLEVAMSAEAQAARLAEVPPFKPKIDYGYLRRYAQAVTSASRGAILER
jgi:dihydroxy-acid dehydratase